MTMTTNSMINEFQDNNVSIKVHWEDTMDNYTVQREKEIEKYFKAKYKTDKVKVIFKAILSRKSGEETVEAGADASEMVLDNNYQKDLIDKFLVDNNLKVSKALLDRLDGTVNTHLEDYKDNTNRYKKFRIRSVEFSNFLSYGPKNRLNFDGKQGITSIISEPANYGGKTTATIDVLLFLFFGDTTKSEKNIDIFNRFSDSDEVRVRGEIELEGETYVLERVLTRTKQKDGEYKVTSSIEFQQKLIRGGFKNLKGDEKKLTEQLIKEYVGTKDDFLITILSTGDNLDELIKTKPTERGRILTRFIGLEFFREKEKIAKRLFDEWKHNSKMYKHNLQDISKNIESFTTKIEEGQLMKVGVDRQLESLRGQIEEKKQRQDTLQALRIPIDMELYKLNEDEILRNLELVESRIAERAEAYKKAQDALIQPETMYDVDRLMILNSDIQTLRGQIVHMEAEIKMLERTNQQLKDSENCYACKQPLKGVDNSDQITENQKNIENLVAKISSLNENISVSLQETEAIKATKALWDDYNTKAHLADKVKLEVETYKASRDRGLEKLTKYRQNKENVEKNRLIDTDLYVIKNQLQKLEEERDMALLQSRGYEKDVEMAEKRIAEYNLLVADIKKEEIVDKVFRTYLDIYGKNGISKMVLSTMIPLINHHLKALLSETCEFILEMRMNEKNEVEFWMIDEATGIAKPLGSGSGFEKTVSSLALRCVLTKVCSLPKPNIILFDEVFSRVANDNLEKIGLFFDKIKTYFEHIWLISHNPLITEWADHTIKIRKTNNISEIVAD